MTSDIDLLQGRAFKRGIAIGALLMATVMAGLLHFTDGLAEAQRTAADRRADSLQAALIVRDRKIHADSVAMARLTAQADSSSALARRALAQRPRTVFATTSDTSTPAAGDTVARVLVMRSVDVVPISAPKFLVDEIAEQERKLGFVMRAWQDAERARIFADSVYIPDLRRQLEESGALIRAEHERIAERDATIERKDRQLAIAKAKGKLGWIAALIVTGVAVAK